MLLILALVAVCACAAKVVFFGDAHFDRGVRAASKNGDPSAWLEPTRPLRELADWSALNLENPLCAGSLPPIPKRYSLRGDTLVAPLLRGQRFTHAILANNHSMDRGLPGLAATLRVLERSGIHPVGASVSGDPCRPSVVGKGIDSVAFLALTSLPGLDSAHVCADAERLHPWLQILKARRIPSIVSMHWGREGSPGVEESQRALSRKLVSWGASAVVGHHAHVVQSDGGSIPSSVGGAPVWYGLGNFVFDQHEPWTRRCLAAWIETDAAGTRGRSIELDRTGPRSIARPSSPTGATP